MSQSGLLDEEEVKNYINDSFNLKLTRDAFLKPSREVIVDIYSRFLDDTHLKWRKAKDPDLENTKIGMAGKLRFIFSRFNTPYEFHIGDLLNPTRKRTVSFLNVLIYMRALAQDRLTEFQQAKNERLMQQEEFDKLESELSAKRLELEQMALKLANMKPIEELKKLKSEKTVIFKQLEASGLQLATQAKEIKNNNRLLAESNTKNQAAVEDLEKNKSNLLKALQTLKEGPQIRENVNELQQSFHTAQKDLEATQVNKLSIADALAMIEKLSTQIQLTKSETMTNSDSNSDKLERHLEEIRQSLKDREREEKNLKDQLESLSDSDVLAKKLKVEQLRLANLQIESEVHEKKSQHLDQIDEIKKDIKRIQTERSELKDRKNMLIKQSEMRVAESKNQLEIMKKKINETHDQIQQHMPGIDNYCKRLHALFVKPLPSSEPPAVNRTYIKE